MDVAVATETVFRARGLAKTYRTGEIPTTGGAGRRPTVMLAPELTTEQRRAVKVFELQKWAPQLFHV